jgi:hypothetical protein
MIETMEIRLLPQAQRAVRGATSRINQMIGPPLWAELSAPVRVPIAWYVRAWARRLRHDGDEPAPVPPSLALAAQSALDETVLTVARLVHRTPDDDDLARIEAEASAALELFASRGWLDDPASYHDEPPPLVDYDLRKARSGAIRYTVMSFDSGYAPHDGEPGRDRWLADRSNQTAYVWMLRHAEPRPWIVCVHGAAMGQAAADLRVFRAAWLHSVLGLNVALPIQPRHGPRRAGLPVGVGFPNQDLLDNVHAVTQSVWDIRRLIGWIRLQGNDNIAVQGLSLGGYTSALLAGIERDLSCVILGIPAVDFAALMERHAGARFGRDERLERLTELARQVHRVISPLAVEPQIPWDRRFIYAGLGDRLVHPMHQIREIARHWDEPEIHWFSGSHVGFFMSRPVHEFLERALRTSDVAHPATVTAEVPLEGR